MKFLKEKHEKTLSANDRNSEIIFLEGFKQVFSCQKKVSFILFERTRLKKKRKNKERRSINKKFYKRDERMKKGFLKKMKKRFIKKFRKKKKHKQKKHKRESRNMERTTAKMH